MFWEKECWAADFTGKAMERINKTIDGVLKKGYTEHQVDAMMYALYNWGFDWTCSETIDELINDWFISTILNHEGKSDLRAKFEISYENLRDKYKTVEKKEEPEKKRKVSPATKMAKWLWEEYCNDVDNKMNALKQEYEDRVKALEESYSERLKVFTQDKPLLIKARDIKTGEVKDKLTHNKFTTVLNIINSQSRIQKNLMLVGPAGSGKTQLAGDVAQALGLRFYPMSVGPQTTKSDLLGFVNPYGKYITTPIREAFEFGGILLLDEFDAAHPGVVTILNSLLANGHCSFPDKIVNKHKDFICIVACNTYGDGTSYEYIGRNKLDAATLDRFIAVNVNYDDALSSLLTKNKDWYDLIMKIRKNATENHVDVVISTRTLLNGADLIDNGFTKDEALELCLFKGCSKDVKDLLLKDIEEVC